MNKIALAATAALIAAGSGFAFAQAPATPGAGTPGAGGPGMGSGMGRGMGIERLTREDMASLIDARIAAVRAGLKFTPDQERLWQPVEEIMRRTAAERAERMEQWRNERQSMTPDERRERMRDRMEERADLGERFSRMSRRGEMMKTYGDTMGALWASLDDRQKRLFPVLMRPVGGQRMGWHRGHGHDRMGGHHRDRDDRRGDWRGNRQDRWEGRDSRF